MTNAMRMQHCAADFSTLLLTADKPALTLYSFAMLRFLTIIFTVLSFAVASFVAQAHENGMVSAGGSTALSQHMEHVSSSKTSCDQGKTCTSEPALCAFVCAGISVFVPLDRASMNEASRKEKYLRSPDAALMTTVPGMDDRPPIARLL
jgi:hypothetical protein